MTMVKIVRIDGVTKPITDFKKTTYNPEIKKLELYSYPVFTVPEDFARHMVSQRPAWYKLFESKPLSCPVEDNLGSRSYKTFNPWKPVCIRIEPEVKGGEVKKEYKWVEVTEEQKA